MKQQLLRAAISAILLGSAAKAGADAVIATVATEIEPNAIAIDSVTNKIYVTAIGCCAIAITTIIDGATDSTSWVEGNSNDYECWAAAVNPVTDKIYVANQPGPVTVIDGATDDTASVNTGESGAIAINTVTNRIYALNYYGTVTVINGASNTTTNVSVGTSGGIALGAITVNTATNKIYVANNDLVGTVTVINGTDNSTATMSVGKNPYDVTVNPVTNKIYVTNSQSSTVTVINGATNSTTTVGVGTNPEAVAVNQVTDKIYVANSGSGTVTVIDGATDSTTTVNVGTDPVAVAVNQVTDKIYVANFGNSSANYVDGNVTVIDGATDSTATVSVGPNLYNGNLGPGPIAVAVNSVTDLIYVVNFYSNNVSVIDGNLTAVRPIAPQFKTAAMGYNGVFAVYSLNGRQLLKTSFSATATRESILHMNNKNLAMGVYKYFFLKDKKVMNTGSFVVK
jgi:YVTN family beta-propeller protein